MSVEELEREMRGLGPRKGTANATAAPGQTALVTNNKILVMNKPAAAAAPEKPAAAPPMQRASTG